VASYELLIKPSAVQELEDIDSKRDRQGIVDRIQALARVPRPPGSLKLTGRDGYRVRQGSFRILYEVDDEKRTVTIFRIGHRRDVYD
jgi:mRNA interferase RelE/StbE